MSTIAENGRAFTEDDACACGGVFVPRRDGQLGRRCGRCGAPEPGITQLEAWVDGAWVPLLIRRRS